MQTPNSGEIKRAIELSEKLKASLNLLKKEEINALTLNSETNYSLTKMLSDGDFEKSFNLNKYMLSGNTGYDYIDPRFLDKGNSLYDSLIMLIKETLNKDYLTVYIKPKSFSFQNNDLFSLKFYNSFKQEECGRIIGLDFNNHNDYLQLAESNSNWLNKINVSVELVKKGMLSYEGNSIKDKDVLIYGADVESNRCLDYFLKEIRPNKVLNIIPYHNSIFIHDNVD